MAWGQNHICVAQFLVALIRVRTVNFSEIATAFCGDAKSNSHYRRIQRFFKEVKPRLNGRCFLIRFADDAIMGFEVEEDARRVAEVLPKRFGKYGLSLHPDKIRMVRYIRPARGTRKDRENGTFDFLGFTHYLAKSRQGYWMVKRRTIRKRLRRAICRFTEWCKCNRHMSIKEQWEKLSQKLRGYYQYYGIRGNYDSINWVYYMLKVTWRRWLSRRSQKGHLNGEKFQKILDTFPLPKPRSANLPDY